MKKVLISLVFLSLPFGISSFGDEAKRESRADEGLLKSFRCEKFRNAALAELKLKLVENCNLNKPFSFGASENVTGEGSYTYCCHSK